MIYFLMLIFTFVVFAFFIFFETFIAKKGKFQKTKILLLTLLAISLTSLLIGFVLASVYASYNHEHYSRGIIKIGNLIKSGYTEEATKAIDRFANEPVNGDIFSLDASLAIHRIIDDVMKEKILAENDNLEPTKKLKEIALKKTNEEK